MVWDNTFDPSMYIFLDTCQGNAIYLMLDGMNIVLISHISTEEELSTLPQIYMPYGSEQNPNTVKTGKVSTDNNNLMYVVVNEIHYYCCLQIPYQF